MSLLSKKQKKELVYILCKGFVTELPKLTKIIVVMTFLIIGTLLGIDCWVLIFGFAVANGNDMVKYIQQFIKD